MSRLTVPVGHAPAWLFAARRFEAHHRGRRFLCSAQIALSVEGPIPETGEPSPLRFAMTEAEGYPVAPIGRPFLRPDARTVLGDAIEVPRTGLDVDDYAIPLGQLIFDLRLVAIVHHLYPRCLWRAPVHPGFAAALLGDEIVALVASFAPNPAEEATVRAMGVHHGA